MQTKLEEDIKDKNGNLIAHMVTTLNGDGSTPVVMTVANSEPIGYMDDGHAIIPKLDSGIIAPAQEKFMAKAIQTQKVLSEQNGINPDVVNMIGAEK